MSEEPYALIGTCEICGAVNAIDLDGTEQRQKDMQSPNRTVTRVTHDTARTLAEDMRPCAHAEDIASLRDIIRSWQQATGYDQPSAARVGIPALRDDHKRLLEENEKLKRLAYDPADGTPWQTVCELWAKKYDAAERAMKENLDRAVHAESTNEEALSKLRGEWQKATGYDTPAVAGTVLTMLKNDLNALQYQRAVEKDASYPPDIERALDANKVVSVRYTVPQLDALKQLRELCGYVENGTSDVVTLFQDDATKEWILKLGTGKNVRTFSASSIAQVIEGAADAIKA